MCNCRVISKHQICIGAPQEDNGPKKNSELLFLKMIRERRCIESRIGHGVIPKEVSVINNHVFDENNVMAGPGNQTCQEQ